jgi:LysR family transcriptional regulator, hydrogen peroxide-inducible genes activator
VKSRPHGFTLRQLQYACAVADDLSFRRAAERCRVAQPSLSAQIAELEAALHVKLFERDRRRVLLTLEGRALIERARKLLLEADDLDDAAKQLTDPFAGSLSIGVIPTVAPYLLPAATAAIRSKYPKLLVRWVEDKTEPLREQLDAGTLDGALLALEADLGDVEHALIAEDPFMFVAPPDHPLMRDRSPVSFADLRGAEMLLLDEGHCLRQQALEFCSTVRARELEFRATSLATLVQLVVQGAGVTLLPALAVPTETSRATLGIREIAAPPPHRTLAVIWRRSSPLGRALAPVAAAIRENYPGVAATKHSTGRGTANRPPKQKRASRRTRVGVS